MTHRLCLRSRVGLWLRNHVSLSFLAADLFGFGAPYLLLRQGTLNGHLKLFSLRADGSPEALVSSFAWYPVLMALALFLLAMKGHYSRRKIVWEELRDLSRIVVVVALLDAILLFFSNGTVKLQAFLLHWPVVLVLSPLARAVLVVALDKRGWWRRPTVVVGTGENAYQLWFALHDNRHLGRLVHSFLKPPGEGVYSRLAAIAERHDIPIVDFAADLPEQLREMGYPAVTIALEEDGGQHMQVILDELLHIQFQVDVVPSVRGIPLYGLEAQYVFGSEVLLLRARNNLRRASARLMKRSLDVVASLTLLTVLSPLFLWISWKILRQSGRPLLFGHTRVGRGGRQFKCYKFRTMVANAQDVLEELLAKDPEARAEWERDFKLRDDPRITGIGKFLRTTSLDELPQLLNVLRGDMSLVGPRPIVAGEVERYAKNIIYYYDTYPGITGLWQISGRNDVGYERRVYLDIWYVKNWSLWYDLLILVLTLKVVFRREGAY